MFSSSFGDLLHRILGAFEIDSSGSGDLIHILLVKYGAIIKVILILVDFCFCVDFLLILIMMISQFYDLEVS